MKYLCIASVFFATGFLFPALSGTVQLIVGLFMLLATTVLLLNIFDDRFEDVVYE